MESEILLKYKKMQGRFNLPKLSLLKDTFNFELDSGDNTIDHIRMEISDRLFNFTEKIIEPIIGGADSFCCMYEQEMITQDKKIKLFNLYKKIQALKWENNLLIIQPNEKKTAEWIKKTWDLWNKELGCSLENLCSELSKNWHDLKLEEINTNYHG